ncbi:unnamed protein product [[Candida] boidinii]|nr:unnamed protein product [[Candida] boidinii]
MVFRTFLNLSRGTRSSSTYIGRNAKKSIKDKFCGTKTNGNNTGSNNNNGNHNTTAGSGSNGEYTHPFFNPSYQKPNELSLLDNVTNNSNGNTNNNSNNFTKPHPSSAAIQNYIIFDSYNPQNNTNNNTNNSTLENIDNNLDNKDDQIIFKMTNFKPNKNGQLNISIESITSNKTTLNIRRLNSNSKKTLILNNNFQFNLNLLRTFSTNIKENTNDKELLGNFEKLTINEESTDNQNKIELIEDGQLTQQQNEFIDTINDVTKIEEIETVQQREQHQIAELDDSLNLIKDSNEFTEQKIINTSSHLEKTPELINSNTKDSIPSMDESLSNPDIELSENVESFLTQQEFLINNLLKINKHNEVLSLFLRIRGKNIIPNLSIYNSTLKSIPLRSIVDETIENKLTHLLNVYSDMLSNNIKPNNETYNLIINPLLSGSLESYIFSNFKDGYDFLKIAMELFLITNNTAAATNTKFYQFNDELYLNLIKCLNNYQAMDFIHPVAYYNIIKNLKFKDESIKLNILIELINFSKYFKDLSIIEFLYNDLKNFNPKLLESNQYNIYSSLIESFNFSNNVSKSTKMLNDLLSSNSNISKENISLLLSSYLKGLTFINLNDAYLSLMKFNSIESLPDVNLDCLLIMLKRSIELNDSNLILKLWNFILINSKFDNEFNNLKFSDYNRDYGYISNTFNLLFEYLLKLNNNDLILKFTRELIIKDSLTISINNLLPLINYLSNFKNENSNNLLMKLINNQGLKYKKSNNVRLNEFLSLIVNSLSNEFISNNLFNSNFFKSCCEDYRLIDDNIFGLLKVFEIKNSQNINSNEDLLKLNYYSEVLKFEFEDLSNYYVNLPKELENFKTSLINNISKV